MNTDADARKGLPIHTGFNAYFPLAIAEVARLSMVSNEKHNPGEPLHWSKDKSNDHADCLMRHQLEWDTMDDDGFYHAVKVAWRGLAQLQILLESKVPVTVADQKVLNIHKDWKKLEEGWTRTRGRIAADIFNKAFMDAHSDGIGYKQEYLKPTWTWKEYIDNKERDASIDAAMRGDDLYTEDD